MNGLKEEILVVLIKTDHPVYRRKQIGQPAAGLKHNAVVPFQIRGLPLLPDVVAKFCSAVKVMVPEIPNYPCNCS